LTLFYLLYCLPALAIGTYLGVALFGRMSDAFFRRAALVALFLSGLAFVV
jgi:uncharacterized membrane protein YfcA